MEKYHCFSLSPFRISTMVFYLGTNSGLSPLSSGFLKISQCYWRRTLNETYFSMLYPHSKKSELCFCSFHCHSLPNMSNCQRLIMNEAGELKTESTTGFIPFGSSLGVLKAPRLHLLFSWFFPSILPMNSRAVRKAFSAFLFSSLWSQQSALSAPSSHAQGQGSFLLSWADLLFMPTKSSS